MNLSAATVVEALVLAERRIRLLERVQPLGLAMEIERLVAAWKRGCESLPYLRYGERPELSELREGLAVIVEWGCRASGEPRWVSARAEELALQAELVEHVGLPSFGDVARRLFPLPKGDLAERVQTLVTEWQRVRDDGDAEPKYRAGDEREPKSLYSVIRDRLAMTDLHVLLRVEREMSSVAATGDGVIRICSSAQLSHRQARRIAEHEILAHLLPRYYGKNAHGPFKCGCALASADEEGRALVIEERLGLMDGARQRELSWRHTASVWSRSGADFVEVVRGLVKSGAELRLALTTALRSYRGSTVDGASSATGGGLGREIIYLPAYVRLKEAFEQRPELERWFERGRVSLDFARECEKIGSLRERFRRDEPGLRRNR